MRLADLLQQSRFTSPAQEALLNVIATEAWITSQVVRTLSPYDLTPNQYNVLRILRGNHPEPYTCSCIAARLVDRTPDVTRLLCRLERTALVARRRSQSDRRVVEVNITDKGIDLLGRLEEPMQVLTERLTQHLSEQELVQLSSLLERFRTDQEPTRNSKDDVSPA